MLGAHEAQTTPQCQTWNTDDPQSTRHDSAMVWIKYFHDIHPPASGSNMCQHSISVESGSFHTLPETDQNTPVGSSITCVCIVAGALTAQ